MLIGYMYHRKKPMGLNRAYAFASVAKAEGAELLYFSPGAIDFEARRINGYVYRNGTWEDIVSPFPDVVCNVKNFFKKKQLEAAKRLQREIPFTSISVGTKMVVYNNLMKYKEFAAYLVPTERVSSARRLLALTEQYPRLVLKPAGGHQGENICYIRRDGNVFKIQSDTGEINCDEAQISEFISDRLRQESYIAQPYINSRTKAGNPYDLRLHVQKNAGGEWVSAGIYPRISADGGIICNISRGGYTLELADFLTEEFGGDAYDVKKYVEIFSLQLAAHLDEIQRELYGEELDELGIDIGLDENRQIYIYEVNWKPGHPPLLHIDLSVVRNTIHYAMFLASRKAAAQQTNDE